MQSRSSNRAEFLPEPDGTAGDLAKNVVQVDRYTNVGISMEGDIRLLPIVDFDMDADPAPNGENEAEGWIAAMVKNPKKWFPKLAAASTDADLSTVHAQFERMYTIYAPYTYRNFLERHFRRPDAPSDAKPFPLRIEITALLWCIAFALIGVIILAVTHYA